MILQSKIICGEMTLFNRMLFYHERLSLDVLNKSGLVLDKRVVTNHRLKINHLDFLYSETVYFCLDILCGSEKFYVFLWGQV